MIMPLSVSPTISTRRLPRLTPLLSLTTILISVLCLVAVPWTSAVADSVRQPWPITLRTQMVRLGAVGYRLRRTARNLCPVKSAQTGLSIDYIEAYRQRDRSAISALLSLSDKPQVVGVAPGSPAAAAGVIAGDEILAVNGTGYQTLAARAHDASLLADELEERLGATTPGTLIQLRLARGGRTLNVDIHPEIGCGARFVVKTDGGAEAYSDEHNLAIASRMIGFTRNEDELALIAGHELAHIIHHDAATHGSQREKEKQADILGAELVRCSGFDLGRALEFWSRYRREEWLKAFTDTDHPTPATRAALIREQAMSGPCPPQADLT